MPLIKRKISIAAGATSDNVFANTTYQTVDAGTRLVISAAASAAGTAAANTSMDFNVNNAEFAADAVVSELVSGEPFGWNNTGYVMNDMQTVGAVNRPILTFTNGTASTVTVDVAVFVGG